MRYLNQIHVRSFSDALHQLDGSERDARDAAAPALVRLVTALTAAERGRSAQQR